MVNKMVLTRHYNETIKERVQREPEFSLALLNEAISHFLNGEPEIAKLILQNLVNIKIDIVKSH